MSKSLYNLHVYFEEIEILHVITYKGKYVKFMNSVKFFLSEQGEMKSCIYRVETANAGMRMWKFWHHLLVLLLAETGSSERVCQIKIVTRVCNHNSMLTLQVACLRFFNSKRLIGKSWNIV